MGEMTSLLTMNTSSALLETSCYFFHGHVIHGLLRAMNPKCAYSTLLSPSHCSLSEL